MRKAIFFVVPAVALCGGIAFAACGGDDTSTTPGSCQDVLEPEPCFDCIENSCCDPLIQCRRDPQCLDCLSGNKASCASPKWPPLFQCGDASCHDKCVSLQILHADCTAPDQSVSGGKCVTIGGNFLCNPVTNDKCDTAGGEACDFNPATGQVSCFSPPNDRQVCESCGQKDGFCTAGHTCLQSVALAQDGVTIQQECTRVCCDDSDCGPDGACKTTTVFGNTAVGGCLKKEGGGGAGGTGGGGGTGGTGGGGGAGGK